MKINLSVVKAMVKRRNELAPVGSPFHIDVIDPRTKHPIIQHIKAQWVVRFCDVQGVVCRTQIGNLLNSPAKQQEIDLSIVCHLAQLKWEFENGELEDDLVFNMDENSFHVDMDDSKTLDWRGVFDCKYHDVTSGGKNFTCMVHLGGGRCGTLEPAFHIFQYAGSNYPIRGCPDDISGVVAGP